MRDAAPLSSCASRTSGPPPGPSNAVPCDPRSLGRSARRRRLLATRHAVAVLAAASSFLALSAAPAVAEADPVFSTVALSGRRAPGIEPAVTYGGFVRLGINQQGQVVFEGALSGPGVSDGNDRGIWVGEAGNLVLVAREGDNLPGTDLDEQVQFRERDEYLMNADGEVVLEEDRFRRGVQFRELDTAPSVLLNLNDDGQVAFSGTIRGNGINARNDSGIWAGTPDAIQSVARTGDAATGAPAGVEYSELQTVPSVLLLINRLGQVAYHARLRGPGVDDNSSRGLWAGSPGNMVLVARGGDPAPGTPDGVYFDSQPIVGFVFNDAGTVAFQGRLAGPGVTPANELGIWAGRPGAIELVVRQQSPAPGGRENWQIIDLSTPVINEAGQLAFAGQLAGPGIGSLNRGAVWVGPPEQLKIAVQTGSPAPGCGASVVFYSFDDPVINATGAIALRAHLAGEGVVSAQGGDVPNNEGIWAGPAGSLGLVARTGETAPGTSGDTRFESFGPALVLNAGGEVAFRAELVGPEVMERNDRGIWAGRPGAVQLVVREGDTIEVAPGDERIIEVLSFGGISGGQDGRNTSFNDAGQLVFSAYFRDGTRGVFIATLR